MDAEATVWHVLDIEPALQRLDTRADRGLTAAEAATRLVRFGRNELREGRRRGPLAMFLWEQARGESLEVARTAAVNTLVMFEVVYLLNTRFLLAPAWPWRALAGNPWVPASIVLVLALQLLYTYAPFMQTLFHSAALDAGAWVRIVLIAASIYVIVEIEKWLVRGARWRVV